MSSSHLILPLILVSSLAQAGNFTLQDDGKRVTILDTGKPVLTYNYGFIDPPEEKKADMAEKAPGPRTGYVHPIYGLDGDRLTDDYPSDHLHHRGLFWAWPLSTIGGKRFDLWLLKDCHSVFVKWLEPPSGGPVAKLAAENGWVFSATPGVLVREQVRLVVHPADQAGRAIDVALDFTNVSGGPVTIQGQLDESNGVLKGYGGLTLRFDGTRQPTVLTNGLGDVPEDIFRAKTPWSDLSSPIKEGGPTSGIAVFQNSGNPSYPHEGWILRHYGVIGASWPCEAAYNLPPNETLKLQYRLYVHRGNVQEGKVAEHFAEYEKEQKKSR
jgi:hypothetical protein